MNGITGTPLNMRPVSVLIGSSSSAVSGDGDVGAIFSAGETTMPVSASTLMIVARTESIGTFGNTRQFTSAVAVCGSALSACPPLSRVATQVVRRIEL